MIKTLNEKWKSARNALGLIIALVTLGSIGKGISDIVEIKATQETQRLLIEDLKNQVHEKEIACETMKTYIVARGQNVEMCKP